MTKARVNADNVTADIAGITAGTGITGGGTSGTVTITNDMATTIAAAGDLIYGTANDAYAALSLGTAGKVLKVNSGATAPEWAVDPTTDVVTTAGDLIYGTGADAVDRLGIGTAGQVLKVNSGATAPEWGSSGTTWTQRTVLGQTLTKIAHNGSLYIAVGGNGSLSTSPDGITWTARTSGFGSNLIRDIFFGNGLWVIVGDVGLISTSPDGITWTARTSNMATNDVNAVIYANSIWVAIGGGGSTTNTGGITYSTDGITWTRKSQSLTVGGNYTTIIFNGTNFVVGTNFSTNNFLYASTPSGTWTVGHSGSSTGITSLFYDGTRQLEVTNTGALRFSTSATFGTSTAILGATLSNSKDRNFYFDGKIYQIAFQFINGWSTTPESGNYAKKIMTELSPAATNAADGTIATTPSIFFINSTGQIVGGQTGQIFTSF